MHECWKDKDEDRPTFPDIVSKLTCILDSNDPADVQHAQTDITDIPDLPGEGDALLHNNPTYLEPMDMMPALPPPAPPTYVNDPEEDTKDETTC